MTDSSTDDDYKTYVDDPRIACKYGKKCYQKNKIHHEKYKHPPVRKVSRSSDVSSAKRMKFDTDDSLAISMGSDSDSKLTESDFPSDFNEAMDDMEKDEKKIESSKLKEGNNSTCIPDISNTHLKKNETNSSWKTINKKQFIKEKFLVEMPDDFYQFWDMCKSMNEKDPLLAFKQVGLTLVGPYDVLAEKFSLSKDRSDDDYLLHWRYYYDPPEFQTVLKGSDKTGFHIGYFRDSPDELPVFMASNCAERDGIINICGENIFAAIYLYLEDLKKSGDPFSKSYVPKYQNLVKEEAESLKLNLSARTNKIIERDRKIVAKTFNKVGLMVPLEKKTKVGYRELALSNKDLKTLLTKLKEAGAGEKEKILSELQPVFTYASIAADECDFGTNIELGWDILSFGIDHLNSTVARILSTSYRLLHREAFANIAEAHLKSRKKGCNLSTL